MHKHWMFFFFAASVGGAGCRCSREPTEVRRPDDDAKVVVHDATPKPKVHGPRFVLVRTDLVDLETKSAMPWFGPKPPAAWAADETNLYVADGGTIRAAAPPEKGTTWTDTMPAAFGAIRALVTIDGGVVGVFEHDVSAFDAESGKRRLLVPGAGGDYVDARVLGDALFVLDTSGIVTIVELATGTIRVTSTPPSSGGSNVELRPFPEIGLICRATRGAAGSIDCFDGRGPAKTTGFAIATSCAYLRGSTAHHLLYSGSWSACGTWAIRVDDAASSFTSTEDVAALVEKPDGTIEGALSFTKTTSDPLRMLDATGATKWATTIGGFGESLSVVAQGERLFVSRWDRIATGSSLVALDRSTGKLLWTADVEQLGIPHSKYRNDVELSLRGDELVLVGVESGGSYVQLFDAATGARRFSHLVK